LTYVDIANKSLTPRPPALAYHSIVGSEKSQAPDFFRVERAVVPFTPDMHLPFAEDGVDDLADRGAELKCFGDVAAANL